MAGGAQGPQLHSPVDKRQPHTAVAGNPEVTISADVGGEGVMYMASRMPLASTIVRVIVRCLP